MILRTDKAAFTENYMKGASTKDNDNVEEDAVKAIKTTPNSANNTRSPGPVKTNDDNNMESDEDFLVRCPCGGNKDDGIMILCENCKNWQHSVCFCITDEEAVPDSHVCDVCATENDTLKCTDSRLSRLSVDERQELCLIRRSLIHCRSVEIIEPGQLSEILGVEITVGNGLFCALQKDGVLVNPKRRNKNKGLCKVVDKTALEDCLSKKYFNDYNLAAAVNSTKVTCAATLLDVSVTKNNPRKRINNNNVVDNNLSMSATNISLEDNDISLLNASQDSMLTDAPLKKKRRACVVKTPVVASRH